MDFEQDIDAVRARRICIECVGEAYLSAQIKEANDEGTCHYCAAENVPTITIEDLASEVASAFERHYRRTDTDPDGLEYVFPVRTYRTY